MAYSVMLTQSPKESLILVTYSGLGNDHHYTDEGIPIRNIIDVRKERNNEGVYIMKASGVELYLESNFVSTAFGVTISSNDTLYDKIIEVVDNYLETLSISLL